MHAVSISLGATSAIVSVANAQNSSAQKESQTAAPIRVTANSAGHRSTPTMAAFAEHDELLFGEDARALFARTPHVVMPYIFAFAALAEQRGGSNESRAAAAALRAGLEDAARRRYKGYCALVPESASEGEGEAEEGGEEKEKGDKRENEACSRRWRRVGFRSPHEAEEDGSSAFLSAEEVLTQFFNHVKRHTIDGACGLTASDSSNQGNHNNNHNNNNTNNSTAPASNGSGSIVLTIVLPRYMFHAALSRGDSADVRGALQWVRDALLASHLSPVSAHISLLFRDEAALFAMDALRCSPPAPHPMSGRHFLLPAAAAEARRTAGPWPSARVLVVDWGALGVSLTRLRLVGGCLAGEPRPPFLRAQLSSSGAALGVAAERCGGGEAIDVAIAERLAMNFAQQHRRSLGLQSIADFPARAQRKLLLAAEERKIALSKAAQVPVEVEALVEGMDLRDAVTCSRARVDAALRGEWQTLSAFEKVLREFLDRLSKSDSSDTKVKEEEKAKSGEDAAAMIDVVILCGGMLQMPCIAQSLRQLFTRLATSKLNNSRSDFSPNLVIMDAGVCTTISPASNNNNNNNNNSSNSNSNDKASDPAVQTVGVSTTVGAEELASVGGCLHGYHLALTALKEGSPVMKRSTGKTKPKAKSRRQREEEECTRYVWRALTRYDKDEDDDSEGSEHGADELLVLKRPVWIYTATNSEPLRAALEEKQKDNAEEENNESDTKGLRLPAEALAELFAAHTPLPARVIVPIGKRSSESLVLYLFTTAACGARDEKDSTEAIRTVLPLRESGVVLSLPDSIEDSEDAQMQDMSVVFSLQSRQRQTVVSEDASNDYPAKASIELLVQLVCSTEKATESLNVGACKVVESIKLDL